MFCPNCGQERVSIATNYCSRCGYLLTGTAELLQLGGGLPNTDAPVAKRPTPRSRGVKQGLFIFLLTFLIVPLVAIFSAAIDIEPWAVAITAIILFVGGLLRMAYAFMFESATESDQGGSQDYMAAPRTFAAAGRQQTLPPQQSAPISSDVQFRAATGTWRDTRDLQPSSVTDGTTKLLEKDELGPQ